MSLLTLATKDTIEQLREVDWFTAVGNKPALPENWQTRLIFCDSWVEAVYHCSKTSWENLRLNANDVIYSEVRQQSPEVSRHWNEVVGELRPIVNDLVGSKTRVVVEVHKLPVKFVHVVRWDVLGILLEAQYGEFLKTNFYVPLGNWYLEGHFPCGWEGEYPDGKLIVF